MTESNIYLQKADDPQLVAAIVRETIQEVYPRYYPEGAVQFFLDHHNRKHIENALRTEEVYLLIADETVIGTGSIRGNEICRLFILPIYQRNGYGRKMLNQLEEKIFLHNDTVHVDASFPAEMMYLKNGYQITSYEKIETSNGDFLCYHIMRKIRKNK